MAGLNFNAQDVAPQQAFENLAPGWYTVKMVESEMKPTSAGTGSYLECTFEVLAPAQFAGRKLWDRLNLNNPNEKAVEIAYQTLSAMCHATGVMQVQDSQQLHNLPMDAKVGMSKVTEQYPEPRNELKGYRACQGGGMGQAAAPQQQAPQQQGQQWGQQPQQNQAPQQQGQQWGQQPQQNQAPQQQGQQWGQQPQQNQAPQHQQQQAEQPVWGQQPVEQQPQQQQAQQQAPAQEQPQQMNINQAPTDQNAQQAAQSGTAPWQQQQ